MVTCRSCLALVHPNARFPPLRASATAQAMSTTIFSKVDVSLNYVCVSCKLFYTVLCNALEQVLRRPLYCSHRLS